MVSSLRSTPGGRPRKSSKREPELVRGDCQAKKVVMSKDPKHSKHDETVDMTFRQATPPRMETPRAQKSSDVLSIARRR
jgi:hypothetical protein